MTVGQFRPGTSSLSSASDNTDSYFYVDGFSDVAVVASLTKAVAPSSISSGGTATYTFTVDNTAAGNSTQIGLGFTDALPSGLQIASTPGVVVTGLASGSVTATAGGSSIVAAGYSIAANTVGTITVNVTNASGQLNASCGANPAAFTNGAANLNGLSSNLNNNATNVCLVVVASCAAGTTAPTLSATTKSNTCPATTADLSTITASNTPAGAILTWHSSATATATTANKLTSITSLTAGTYYAAFYDATNTCYSTTTTPLAVTINTACAAGSLACSSTVLLPAPVVGTPAQIDLIISLGVTTAGTFSPLSVSGSGFSLTNGSSSVVTTTTGLQQIHLPVQYDGSALGSLSFTVGSAGSCSLPLSSLVAKTGISTYWSQDNCILPQAAPALK